MLPVSSSAVAASRGPTAVNTFSRRTSGEGCDRAPTDALIPQKYPGAYPLDVLSRRSIVCCDYTPGTRRHSQEGASMKTRTALASLALSVAQMSYGAGTPTTHSCSDFKPTPEAAARFAELKGACESIVDINGRTFAKVTAIVRRATPNSVTLNIPATDNTFTLKPDPSRRV